MSEPPFYVGYLKLPRGLRRPLVLVVLGLLFADAALAVLAARGQPGPASGAWGTFGEARLEGIYRSHPYPLLQVAGDHGVQTVLLVDEGKHGAPAQYTGPADGSFAEASGYPIYRGDLTVLQLDRPLEALDGTPTIVAPAAPVPATLEGEIVDAKCWAGAMNPGDGKAHKGCGSLCLLGDIPALFVTAAPDGTARWYLMADAGGGAIGEAARSLVGEHLTLAGSVERGEGLSVFTLDAPLRSAP